MSENPLKGNGRDGNDTPAPLPEFETAGSPEDFLDSWKEIAVYLGRDVRTAQRWEKAEGLPVRRHIHEKQGSIYAYRAEIDAWRAKRQTVLPLQEEEEDSTLAEDSASTALESAPEPAREESKSTAVLRWLLALLLLLAVGLGTYRVWPRSGAPKTVTVAVLPFENLSADPSQKYFSDGITEELIVQLGRLKLAELQPIAVGSSSNVPNPSDPLPKIAHALGAQYVVQGSVRRSGDRVRVSAHLVRAADDRHVWDDDFDREMKDVIALQTEVALAIAEGIGANLAPNHVPVRSVNPDAYEAYLRGRFFWNKRGPRDIFQAMQEFQKAIQIDPTYAPAYVGLADCYTLLGSAQMGILTPTEAMPKAKALAEKALALDPKSAEAHASLAHVTLIYDRDGAKAENEFLRAIELNPSYATAHQWYALYLNAVGRSDEALQQLEISRRLDPLSPAIQSALSEAHYFNRQFDQSIVEAQKALEFNPEFTLGYLNLGRALEQLGRYDEAIAAYEKGRELSGKGPAMTMVLARCYALKGEKVKAQELLDYLLAIPTTGTGSMYVPSIYIATIYNALGDNNKAFAYLKKALGEKCEYLIYLDRDPMADSVRHDPRFVQILSEARLKQPVHYVAPKFTQ